MTTSRFTLVEALIAMFACMLVFSATLDVFVQGVRLAQRGSTQAVNHQFVYVLQQEWQRFTAATDATTWRVDDRTFLAGSDRVSAAGRELDFIRGETIKPLLLPMHGATVAFAIEDSRLGDRIAVLRLNWPAVRGLHDAGRPQVVRIVGIGRTNDE